MTVRFAAVAGIRAPSLVLAVLGAAVSLALPAASFAQQYPTRPVRVVVGDAPGGVTDLAARLIAPRLSENMGQQFVVENRAGGTGAIAGTQVAKAAPDGYTLFLATNGSMVINPILQPNLGYDTRDFAPVSAVSSVAYTVVVDPAVPARTLRELIALAKAQPGKFAYASPGNATIGHLLGDWLKSVAGVDMTHVPFKGGAAATTGMLGGQVPVGLLAVSSVAPHVRSGRMRLLAVSSAKRLPFQPDWPTIEESGYPGVSASVWVALVAPVATPKEVITKLNTEVDRVLSVPEVRTALNGQGATVVGGSPEVLATMMRTETANFSRMVKEFGIRVD
jgi:tripartite-type tricarboxylate transporter receptor subunit TctC